MNYNKYVRLTISLMFTLASIYGCIHAKAHSSDYESAVRTIEIGPFEYVDASFAEIANSLFVSSNNELAINGYQRTIGIVACGDGVTQNTKHLSVVMPRQTIYSAMSQLAKLIGMEVKFRQGLFRFHIPVENDKHGVYCNCDEVTENCQIEKIL